MLNIKEIVKTLDSIKVRKYKWKQISPAKIYECSSCGQTVMTNDIDSYKYCHGCGVRMNDDK